MLTLPAVTTDNLGIYFVVVANNFGSVTSSLAELTVFMPPQYFLGNGTNSSNGNQLTMQLSGTPNYPYILLWATNLTPPINWRPVATNLADGNWSFTITNPPAAPAGYYRMVRQ